MHERQTNSGPHGILEVWSRRKWLAMMIFAVPFLSTVGLARFLPDVYEATAMMLVGRQQVAQTFVKSAVTSELETRLHIISQEILSRSRLQELIDRFGLYQKMKQRRNSPEDLINRLRKDIEIEEIKELQPTGGQATIAFSLTYRGENPRTVALVTNTLASMYVEENQKMRQRQAAGTAEFLRAQLEELEKRLDGEERRVGAFKERHIGELPEQQEANMAILQRLNAELRMNTENQMRITERAEREELTRQFVGSAAPPRERNLAGPEGIAARIERLKQELTELLTRFNEKYPDVIRIRTEIATLEHRLAEVKSEGTTATKHATTADTAVSQLRKPRSDIEVDLNALREQEKSLRQIIATYQRRMEIAPHREQEFQELSRDYKTMKELYTAHLQKYKEAQVAESMEQGHKDEFRILNPAIVPEHLEEVAPNGPNRKKLIFLGLVLALALAGGAVMLAEQFDTSFHTVEDLRTFTKVPVLVSIPRIVTATDTHRMRRWFGLGAAVAMLGLMFIIKASQYVAIVYESPLMKLLRVRS